MNNQPDKPAAPPSPFMVRAVRNFLYSGIGTVASFAISFLFAGLTIRYLGLERAGFFMALAALTGLNDLMGDFGLGTPAVRRVAILNAQQDLVTARLVVGSLTTVNFFTSFIVVFPIVIFFPKVFEWTRLESIYRGDAFWATLFSLAAFLLGNTTNSWRAVYSSLERFDLISGLDAVFGFLQGLCGIVVLTIVPTMTAVAATRLALQLARLGVDAWFMNRLLSGVPRPGWAWQEIRPMLNFGGWAYAGSMGRLLFVRANSLILTSYFGSASLPYYEIPQRIFSQIHKVLASQSSFLFPMLSSFMEKASEKLQEVDDRLRWLMAVASITIYTIIALLGPDILGKIIGPSFGLSVRIPLYLACIQGIFHAQAIVPYYTSWSLGIGRPNALLEIMYGILVIATSLFIIPHYSYIGACLAQLWIIPVYFIYTIIVRRGIWGKDSNSWSWLSVFISPFFMFITWLFINSTINHYVIPFSFLYYFILLLGGCLGFVIMMTMEWLFFRKERRFETSLKLAKLPFQYIRKLIYNYGS